MQAQFVFDKNHFNDAIINIIRFKLQNLITYSSLDKTEQF